jgi:putative transposase
VPQGRGHLAPTLKTMILNNDKHQRRSIRLKDYDYSQAGAYFVTICTYNKECIFGKVTNGEMVINEYGKVVEQEWLRTAEIRPNVELDEFIIMPNHMHSIVTIGESHVGATCRSPKGEGTSPLPKEPASASIGAIMAGFKSATTRRINELRGTPREPVWQRNYYEHVIRNEHDLNEIREYIVNNPLKWDLDSENPNNARATSRSPLRKI